MCRSIAASTLEKLKLPEFANVLGDPLSARTYALC